MKCIYRSNLYCISKISILILKILVKKSKIPFHLYLLLILFKSSKDIRRILNKNHLILDAIKFGLIVILPYFAVSILSQYML